MHPKLSWGKEQFWSSLSAEDAKCLAFMDKVVTTIGALIIRIEFL